MTGRFGVLSTVTNNDSTATDYDREAMKSLMTKAERFRAAVAGEEVDRLPVTVWMHFASEHLPGDETAALYTKYVKEYDFDFLKVMNDYRLPLPGIDAFQTAEDLGRFKKLSMDERPFREQILVLNEMRRLMGPEFPLVETVFSPAQVIQRAGGQAALDTIVEHPEAGLAALEVVTEMMCAHVERVAEAGAAGIYFSVDGAGRPEEGGLPDEVFTRFIEPFDRRVLEAAEGLIRVVHVHGYGLDFDRVKNYPAEVWSWSHHHTKPTLSEVRARSSAAIMGGINRERVSRQTRLQLEDDIRATAEEAGTRGLLIAPGCTAPPDTPRHLLHYAVSVARSIPVS